MDLTTTPIYFNVNEMGEPYERHRQLPAAMRTLNKHPNDHIVLVLSGSSLAHKFSSELRALQDRDRKLRAARDRTPEAGQR